MNEYKLISAVGADFQDASLKLSQDANALLLTGGWWPHGSPVAVPWAWAGSSARVTVMQAFQRVVLAEEVSFPEIEQTTNAKIVPA